MRGASRWMGLSLAVLAAVGCSGAGPGDGGTGGGSGGGGTGGSGGSGGGTFTITVLDADSGFITTMGLDGGTSRADFLSATSFNGTRRIGIAYYVRPGTTTFNAVDLRLVYREWNDGVVGPAEPIATMQRSCGLSTAFSPTGVPHVGYLGGDGGSFGPVAFWYQSDAVVALKEAGGWRQRRVARTSADADCDNAVSRMMADVVGPWPAIAFTSTGRYFHAWRNVNNGQFPVQDWGQSNVEAGTTADTANGAFALACVRSGRPIGGSNEGAGGRVKMTIGPDDLPAIVYDLQLGGVFQDDPGRNVRFQRLQTDGGWSDPVTAMTVATHSQTGASLAYHPTEGLGIAATDLSGASGNALAYTSSKNGGRTWAPTDVFFNTGSGGWWPSLAMDPVNDGEPAIASYVCSRSPGQSEQGLTCPPEQDELRISQRIGNNWRHTVVDPEGGRFPQLGFFSDGKRWVVYRDLRTGLVKLAVEN